MKIFTRQSNACPGCYIIFSVWQGLHRLSSDGGISVPSVEECVCTHTFVGAGGSEDRNTLIKNVKVYEEIGCAHKYNSPCEKTCIMNVMLLRPLGRD